MGLDGVMPPPLLSCKGVNIQYLSFWLVLYTLYVCQQVQLDDLDLLYDAVWLFVWFDSLHPINNLSVI